MKRLSKLICSVVLTVAVLGGAMLAGCAQTTDYTAEIKEYQAKLESLAAENEELRAQLSVLMAQEGMSEEEIEVALEETVSEAESQEIAQTQEAEGTETAAEAQNSEQAPAAEVQESEAQDDGLMQILVFGDSIWGNYRAEDGVAARVEHYLGEKGYEAVVYNAAIGGTSATIDLDDNEWDLGMGADASLAKMVGILEGSISLDHLIGKEAYHVMQEVLPIKDQIDVVIMSYGMNDFLKQAELNSSERPWTGYGTALKKAVGVVQRVCPDAQILLIGPTYGSYFSNGVVNMGDKGLFNYAKVVAQPVNDCKVLGMDPYNNMGIDAYDADEYLEDGVHLNALGRDLYAKHVVSCLLGGHEGQVSGNSIMFD